MLRQIGAAVLALTVGISSIVAAEPVTITFRFNDTEAEVRGAIDEFQRHNPDIKIDLQRIGWRDAQNQFLREASSGPASVALSSTAWSFASPRRSSRPCCRSWPPTPFRASASG
jgi:ABC-type glycerol-3-phosphate transport system substrate-binding protein